MAFEGKAGASSIFNPGHGADRAFLYQAPGKFPWANSPDTTVPHKVWFQFRKRMNLAKFGFATRTDHYYWNKQDPETFQVFGSDDCDKLGTNLTILLTVNKAGFTRRDQHKAWLIPIEDRKPFFCYGFTILTTRTKERYAAVQNALMWEERVWE